MPAPLSKDLRERVILAWKNNEGTWEELAERFAVGVASVDRLVRRFRATGSVDPLPARGGPEPRIDAAGREVIRRLLEEKPDLTDDELAYMLAQETRTKVSRSTVGRTVRDLGFTRKKRQRFRRSATGQA